MAQIKKVRSPTFERAVYNDENYDDENLGEAEEEEKEDRIIENLR